MAVRSVVLGVVVCAVVALAVLLSGGERRAPVPSPLMRAPETPAPAATASSPPTALTPAPTWQTVPEHTAVVRPTETYDMHLQWDTAPELLILHKRPVSCLFVVPILMPAAPRTAAGNRFGSIAIRRRARAAAAFGAWLLTAVDPNAAVVFSVRSERDYVATVQALRSLDQESNVSSTVFGNMMVSPVNFYPISCATGSAAMGPALAHLAGIDAAEERWTFERIVLFDEGDLGEQRGPPLAAPTGCVERAATDIPRALETDGPALLAAINASNWRTWHVRDATVAPDASPVAGIRAVGAGLTLSELLMLRSSVPAVQPWRAPAEDVNGTTCPKRMYAGVAVMVPGSIDVTTLDNVLSVVVNNPSMFVIVATATKHAVVRGWIGSLAPYFRANIAVRKTPSFRRDDTEVAACESLQVETPPYIEIKHYDTCFGAMVHAVFTADAKTHQLTPIVGIRTNILFLPVRTAVPLNSHAMEEGAALLTPSQRALATPQFHHIAVAAVGLDRAREYYRDLVGKAAELEIEINGTSMDTAAHNGSAVVWPASDWDIVRVLGRQILKDMVATRPGSPDRPSRVNSWAYDVRDRSSPYYEKYPQYAGRAGSAWPFHEIQTHLDRAAQQGALVFYPIEFFRAIGRCPWRYQIRRRRLDPIAVRAMQPDYKSNLWCDAATLEGCAMRLSQNALQSPECVQRDEQSDARQPLSCSDASSDPRVRAQDVRPPALRGSIPTLVADDPATERERDAPVDGRVKVDVLFSVIAKGDEDAVDIAETWLEHCASCVLAYEVGPTGKPGEIYDRLKRHLAPDVFDRVIVNPKRGLHEPVRAPLLYRHLVNIKYARCFVAPLRVLMVAANEGQIRPGLAEYLLAHSTNVLRDQFAMVAEARDEYAHWMDRLMLGTAPAAHVASQHFVYGTPNAPLDWAPHGFYYCTGKAFFEQTKIGMTSFLGFEGSWFTGAQWNKFDETFQLGYWVTPITFLEHTVLQPTLLEDELRRQYAPETSLNITNTAKPPGRNTCCVAKVRSPGPLTLDELARALDETAEKFQFTIKRIGEDITDPARMQLRKMRKAYLGMNDTYPPILALLGNETAAATAEPTRATS